MAHVAGYVYLRISRLERDVDAPESINAQGTGMHNALSEPRCSSTPMFKIMLIAMNLAFFIECLSLWQSLEEE